MSDSDETVLVAQIIIERRLVGSRDVLAFAAKDVFGQRLPIVETLGLLRLAEDTALELERHAGN